MIKKVHKYKRTAQLSYVAKRKTAYSILNYLYDSKHIDFTGMPVNLEVQLNYLYGKDNKKTGRTPLILTTVELDLLNDTPGYLSDIECTDDMFDTMESFGSKLIEYGLVELHYGKSGSWDYKRTLKGDVFVEEYF